MQRMALTLCCAGALSGPLLAQAARVKAARSMRGPNFAPMQQQLRNLVMPKRSTGVTMAPTPPASRRS